MPHRLFLREVKVAWVTPSFGTGGSLLYLKPLLEVFALSCGAFRVFTPEFQAGEDNLGFEVESRGLVKKFYQKAKGRISEFEAYPGEIRLISPTIIISLLRYQPDLIILNDFSLLSFFAVSARPLLPKIKVLLLVETKPPGSSQNKWLFLVRRALRTLVVEGVDTILTNNIDGGNYLTSELGARDDRVIIRPYLTSDMASLSGMTKEEIWKTRSSRLPKLPIRFLYTGRLISPKGLQYVLSALALLMPKYAGKFCFDVIGDGPFREHLQQQVLSRDLSPFVIFHGKQPYSSLWQWYLQADVFLFPTLSDYRALAPFEALSMGLPIVSSIHDGGVGESVEFGGNGFSCDPRDTLVLAKILAQFLDAPKDIAQFSKRSLEMASSFTLERATKSLIEACQTTLMT